MSLLDAFLEDSIESSQANSTAPKHVFCAIRSDGVDGDGSEGNPYDGSEVTVLLEGRPYLKFDRVLNSLGGNTTINLGPGIFKTQGGKGAARPVPPDSGLPWVPRSGQQIIGSGMFATTLKLVVPTRDADPEPLGCVINVVSSPSVVNDFSISDLTIDCDFGGQPTLIDNAPLITCAAINMSGKNIKVQRVRVIRWGRRSGWECFPITIPWPVPAANTDSHVPPWGADEMRNVVEDCIVERPDWNTNQQVTMATAPLMRNCYFNGEVARPGRFPRMPVSNFSYVGTEVTVATPFAHQFNEGDWIYISGVIVDGVSSAQFNGAWQVAADSLGRDTQNECTRRCSESQPAD